MAVVSGGQAPDPRRTAWSPSAACRTPGWTPASQRWRHSSGRSTKRPAPSPELPVSKTPCGRCQSRPSLSRAELHDAPAGDGRLSHTDRSPHPLARQSRRGCRIRQALFGHERQIAAVGRRPWAPARRLPRSTRASRPRCSPGSGSTPRRGPRRVGRQICQPAPRRFVGSSYSSAASTFSRNALGSIAG